MSLLDYFRRPTTAVSSVPAQHDLLYGREEQDAIAAESGLPALDSNGEDPTARIIYARVLQEDLGWTFEVCKGGVAFMRQEYHPAKGGDQPMTEDEARALASEYVKRYQDREAADGDSQ